MLCFGTSLGWAGFVVGSTSVPKKAHAPLRTTFPHIPFCEIIERMMETHDDIHGRQR
jgi:hypothetical protein